MYFLLIGVLGLAFKFLEIEPVASLNWWLVLSPLTLAVAWWAWADASGYTKRKEIEKMEGRKQKRIDRQRASMGLSVKKRP